MRDLKGRGIKVGLTTYLRAMMPLRSSIPRGWGIGQGKLLDAVVTSDEVDAGRPAPVMIHRFMEAAGVHHVRSVVAGALGSTELEQHPHSWELDGVKDLLGVLESALVSH